MLQMTRTDPEWKDKIITGDETWVYCYDPETKRQSAEWGGQGHYSPSKGSNSKKRPEKWTNGDWILHHDNARPHTAHLVTSFLAKNGTQILPQQPYSPDIAPNDFFLFSKLKAVLKGRHFDTRDDVIEKSLLALKSIPKEAYKNCFDNWEKRWRWVTHGEPPGNTLPEAFSSREKTSLASKAKISKENLIEGLTNGLTTDFRKLVITSKVDTPEEWIELVSKLEMIDRHKEMEESSFKRETAPRVEVQQKQWGHPGRSPMDYSSKRRPCRICLNRGHAGRFHPENRNFNSVEFDEKLSPYEKSDLIKLIKENKEAFAAHKMDIGHIKADPIRIKLTSQTPISLKPFRPFFSDNIEIKRQIEELLKYNVIRPSYSSYASPAMLVNKRNEGKIRLVIDYRKLNDIIKRDSEPIPRIDSILDKLSDANIFTTLDLLSGYHHLDIHPDDKEYTAFTTTHGLYEFNKLSFGLKNSPSQFQRVLRQILNKYDVDFCMNYFDDFIIFSNNFQEHLTHLKVILDICIKENFKLKLSKCKFATYQISFLGYEISNHQFSPSTNNIETIRKLNSPRNKKDLQRVLGSINIYSKFIPNYAKLRLPLNNLLKKDVKWKWDEECETAFSKLKNIITSKPILAIYNPKYPIHLYTDASQEQIGSILKQEQPDGLLKPIAYRSRRMTSYESNYCVTEQECLAIIDAVDFFLPYLDGVHFTIHTDHACLKYLKNIKNPKGRLFRWSLKLSMFDFEIKHIRGTENKEADFLSRYPIAHFVSDPELKQAQFDDNINDRKYTKFNGLLTIKKKGLIKSVVPPSLREKVLIRAHQDYGHIGVSKMLNLISPIYYWPYLIQDISNYVKHCEVCQLNKISHQKKFGLLESLPPAKDPFDLVSIDTVGGLNYYNSTKKFLHIIVDHATRYIWAFPSKNNRKLMPPMSGPFTILKQISPVNYEIDKPQSNLGKTTMVIHSSKLRPYYPKEGFELKLTKSKIPTLEKKPSQQAAPKSTGSQHIITDSRQDYHNEGDHNEEGKKPVQIDRRAKKQRWRNKHAIPTKRPSNLPPNDTADIPAK
ncbi:K02A2.6-like [Cordylochernes scorpioides]|uniref:RNA-directed DNA polymerase n=1 Tax=Cordylochernes scorpioides TaxID=51811 RepID=A0ABY6L9G2_9ARAC|nr:K02A2.6-like [Cordylochernes scorpioides]